MSKKSLSRMAFVPVIFASLLFILQIIVGISLLSDISQIEIFAYCGVALYILSGLVFGMLPMMEFRKQGRVKKGKKLHSHHSPCRYRNIFCCSPSTVYHLYSMGVCRDATFPALDYYTLGDSDSPVDLY